MMKVRIAVHQGSPSAPPETISDRTFTGFITAVEIEKTITAKGGLPVTYFQNKTLLIVKIADNLEVRSVMSHLSMPREIHITVRAK